jgi:hypothetical protein
MRSLMLTYQNSLYTLKNVFTNILKYFLQDADVQNVFIGCLIVLQIVTFLIRQGYFRVHMSMLSLRHAATTPFDNEIVCM